MIWLFKDANYPFLKWRKYAFALSILLTIIPIASIVAHGGLRYSIDFTGGTLVQVQFDQPVETGTLRAALGDMPGLESFEVQRFGEPEDVVIRAQVPAGEEEEFGGRIRPILQARTGIATIPQIFVGAAGKKRRVSTPARGAGRLHFLRTRGAWFLLRRARPGPCPGRSRRRRDGRCRR